MSVLNKIRVGREGEKPRGVYRRISEKNTDSQTQRNRSEQDITSS